ncbi:DUF6415 family natural product biosynthesis protein [Streptomyces sp. NBC_00035]|uniref:DUF6415 family natural product biosynthesis protein n=1 Tax=Streptomyces sp. NBC_00035 TaxID=2903614 RepID=UPI00324E98F1
MSTLRRTLPVDADTIRQHCWDAPDSRSRENAEAHVQLLLGHVQLLLPEVEALLPDQEADSGQRAAMERVLGGARRVLELDYGDTLASAVRHAENLALYCRLLLKLASSADGFATHCAWCKTFQQGTRLVRGIDGGFGFAGAQYACSACRTAYQLPLVARSAPRRPQPPEERPEGWTAMIREAG